VSDEALTNQAGEDPEAPSLIQPLPEEWQAAVGDLLVEGCLRRDRVELVTTAEQILPLLERLRGLPEPYNRLTDMCGAEGGDHLQVLYFLCAGYTGEMVTVKVNLPRDGRLPTATGLYALANWPEREIMEMFGMTFLGHPEHAHLLLPEGWPGYPLRKDYVYDRESEWTRPDPLREDPGKALGLVEEEETEEESAGD
jgi:NADH:ubiquinone oxidoreductase subunit C